MSAEEFASVMAYMEAALQKPLPVESAEVYFDLLGDLPLAALQTAARLVVLEHRWATFPTVAEIRAAAAETLAGEVKELSPAEAWDMAWRAIGRIDPEVEGSVDRGLVGLPPLVAEAIQAFGIPSLCHGRESVSIVRSQFVKIFEQLQARERRVALMPESVKESVAKIGSEQKAKLAAPVAKVIASIGNEVKQ